MCEVCALAHCARCPQWRPLPSLPPLPLRARHMGRCFRARVFYFFVLLLCARVPLLALQVEAHSLSGAAQLNGMRGRVVRVTHGRQGEDRLAVDFGAPVGVKALRPGNLRWLHSGTIP